MAGESRRSLPVGGETLDRRRGREEGGGVKRNEKRGGCSRLFGSGCGSGSLPGGRWTARAGKVVVCDNGTGVSARREAVAATGRGPDVRGRAGLKAPELHPGTSAARSEGRWPALSTRVGVGLERTDPSSSRAGHSLQLGVRTAGEAGDGWGFHLLPVRGRPSALAAGICLRGLEG